MTSSHTKSFLTVKPENIPDDLKVLPQWVLWRGELRSDKLTKVPYTIDGAKASSTNPATWARFEDAMRCYEAGNYDGVGFVFTADGGRVGIDLDRCFTESGKLIPQVEAIVSGLGSYTEYSVSGKGLHVLVRGSLAHGKRNGPIEIYPHGRYFTMTGHVLGDIKTIQSRQTQVDRLVQILAPKKKSAARTPGCQYLNNDELIEKAKTAKNGEKFDRLWTGDTSGYPSQSEADLALLSILLYWTKGDMDRTERLFTQSGLCREKWDRADYRRRCFDYLKGEKIV